MKDQDKSLGSGAVFKVDEGKLLALLQDLIRIPSVNPSLVSGGNGERGIARFIGGLLGKMGLEVRYQELGENRMNVIGILRGTGGGKSLMFNGHIDTVGVDGMSISPFEPVYSDGKVLGRGSLDMKGGVAAIIGAVDALIRAGTKLKGDVYLTLVADEEYASIGTEAIAREYTADAAIVCEPTGLDITTHHKGFVWLRVEVHGVAAHGSLPEDGGDAIVKAGHFLVAVDNLAKTTLAHRWHPQLNSPSIHASTIRGGVELSTYPPSCVIELERRTIPGEDEMTVKAEIDEVIADLIKEDRDFKATCEVLFHRSPFEASVEEAPVTTLREACRRTLGREPELGWTAAWLDSAILKDAGIPTAVFGASGEGAHSAYEYANFESVVSAAKVLACTAALFCGIGAE